MRNFRNDCSVDRRDFGQARTGGTAGTIRVLALNKSVKTAVVRNDLRFSRLGSHPQSREINMRKTIYMAALAGLVAVGSINASYAAGGGGGGAGGGAGGAAGGAAGGGAAAGTGGTAG